MKKLKIYLYLKVGEWKPGSGVNVTDTTAFFEPGFTNVTLVIMTILVRIFIYFTIFKFFILIISNSVFKFSFKN